MDIIFNKNIIRDKKREAEREREREGVVLCWRPIKSYDVVPSLGIDIARSFSDKGEQSVL